MEKICRIFLYLNTSSHIEQHHHNVSLFPWKWYQINALLQLDKLQVFSIKWLVGFDKIIFHF